MKKTISIGLILMILVTVISCFSGCGLVRTLTETEAKEYFHASVDRSMKSEIFYWEELDNRAKDVTKSIKTTFNKYCLLDRQDNILYDENNNKKNFGVQYEQSSDKGWFKEICGASKSGVRKDKTIRNLAFEEYKLKEDEHTTMKEMTVDEYLVKAEAQGNLLSQKLFDLSLLKDEDIIFGGSYDEHGMKIKLVTLKFKIADSFFTDYVQKYGKESVLKGEGVAIEIAYDRISIITVYDKLVLDSSYSVDSEVYRLSATYIGPIVRVPKFSDKKGLPTYTEIK